MEALRPRTASTVDRGLTSEKFTIGLVRVIELFRGVKVPNNEPVSQPQNRPTTATNTQQKVVQPLLINGHRALPLGKAIYALPSMLVPDEHIQTWENLIRERLVDELQLHFRSQICQPEILMVSDSSSKVGPCIVLSVWDESLCNSEDGRKKTIKNANKIVKKLQTMQQCPFPFKVIADKISLAARNSNFGQHHVAYIEASLEDRHSLVGLGLSTDPENGASFRLGGLIRVGAKIYGLTVAHPFICQQREHPQQASMSQDTHDLYHSDSTDSDDEGDQLFGSQHPTFAGEVTIKQQDKDRTFQDEAKPTAVEPVQQESRRAVTLAHSSSKNVSTTSFGLVSAQSNWTSQAQSDIAGDWALIEMNDDVPVLPNLYRTSRDGNMISIDAISINALQPQTAVTILAGSGHHLRGVLGQSNVKIPVDGLNLTVTQIILQRPLTPGYSGSWVIKDNLLVGSLVAVRSFLPIAYMVPASSIIRQIGTSLNSTDVGLDISDAIIDTEPGPSQPTREQDVYSHPSASTENLQYSPRTDLDLGKIEVPRGSREVSFEQSVDLRTSNETEPTLKFRIDTDADRGFISRLPSGNSRSQNKRTPTGPKELETGVDEHTRLLSTTTERAGHWEPPQPGPSSEGLDNSSQSPWKLLKYIATTCPPALLAFFAAIMPAAMLDEISTSLADPSEIRSQLILSIYLLGQGLGVLFATPLINVCGRWRSSLMFAFISAVSHLASSYSKTSTQLIWSRLLSGIGASGSVALLNASTTVGTISQRKRLLWLYATSPPLALGLGPWFGASAANRSWRWSFSLLTGMSAGALLLVALCGRGSDHTNDPSKGTDDGLGKQQLSVFGHITSSFATKLRILGDPIVGLLTLWRTVYFGTLYFIFASFARLLHDKYGLSHAVSGGWYLLMAGGLVLGRIIAIESVWKVERVGSKHYESSPERWLMMSLPSSQLVLAGLVLYGWSAESPNNVALPIIGSLIFSVGLSATPDFVARYTVDVYKTNTEVTPVFSTMNVAMDLAGFGFPLFAPALVRRCGYGWSSTILALSAVSVHVGVVLTLRVLGPRLRARSKLVVDSRDPSKPSRTASATTPSSGRDLVTPPPPTDPDGVSTHRD